MICKSCKKEIKEPKDIKASFQGYCKDCLKRVGIKRDNQYYG